MKMLVTGATGQLGARVVETLLERVPAERVAVSVRDPRKAEHLSARGVEVRQGDFDAPASLDRAFAGVDRLLIISTGGDNETRIRQHLAAVAAAERAGVGFIAYTSIARADTSPLALAAVHRTTEEAIRSTGIPYSFLRNNWYTENEVSTIQAAAAGHPVLTAAGRGKVGWASRDDYADAAAAVLAGSGHDDTVYELSGRPGTYEEFAQAIGSVLGREVPVKHVDDATYEQILSGFGLPDFLLDLLVDLQGALRQGALDVESDDLEALLGRPATPIGERIAQIVKGQ